MRARPTRYGPYLAPGVALGIGMGGFVDGIVLHQVAQWHNMLSARIPPVDLVAMKTNMLWDGLFHVFAWLMTAIGIALLFRARGHAESDRDTSRFVGALAIGWGSFNVVEGVLDHHLLGLHHVHPGRDELAWDLGFLAFGALLVVVGYLLVRPRRGVAPRHRRTAPA